MQNVLKIKACSIITVFITTVYSTANYANENTDESSNENLKKSSVNVSHKKINNEEKELELKQKIVKPEINPLVQLVPESELIEGLILNRTMTRFGYRFYQQFVLDYLDINGFSQHSGLTINERPSARNGSRIFILHKRKVIYRTVLSPATRDIDGRALQAAKYIDQALKKQQQQAMFSGALEPDLAEDEF